MKQKNKERSMEMKDKKSIPKKEEREDWLLSDAQIYTTGKNGEIFPFPMTIDEYADFLKSRRESEQKK